MLIRSISGVRGLTDSHLTAKTSIVYARAIHLFFPDGVIMCGRDSRPSGNVIQEAMTNELVRLGRTIIDCGIVPTPTVQFMVHNTEAVGGFVITKKAVDEIGVDVLYQMLHEADPQYKEKK